MMRRVLSFALPCITQIWPKNTEFNRHLRPLASRVSVRCSAQKQGERRVGGTLVDWRVATAVRSSETQLCRYIERKNTRYLL